MPKFKAQNDTYYRYSYVRKGEEINGGEELYNSPNFEPVDGRKAPATQGAGAAQSNNAQKAAEATYKELCLIAKELGISGYNRMSYPDLAAAIAKAQATQSSPVGEDDDTEGKEDENTGGAGTGEEVKTETAGGENAGE